MRTKSLAGSTIEFVFQPSVLASYVSVNAKDLSDYRKPFFSSFVLLIVNERALAKK